MANRHSFARLEAYRPRARPVAIVTNRWHGHGPERRPDRTTVQQVCDDGPQILRCHSIKLTGTGARSEQADLPVPNHANGLDMPSAKSKRCTAPGLTNVVGHGLFATRALAVATPPFWSQWSLCQRGNDLGGMQ